MVPYCAWDLEIAATVPEGANWDDYHPLGISCAAAHKSPCGITTLWPSDDESNMPFPDRLTPDEAAAMFQELTELHYNGVPLVTWNGAGFDLRVLAEECQDEALARACAVLALDHYDPGYQMVCQKGFMCKLQAASLGMGLEGKLEGMKGSLAPVVWCGAGDELDDRLAVEIGALSVTPGTRGAQDLCLAYVGQDAVATGKLYEAVLEARRLSWITGRGRLAHWHVDNLLTVRECLALPDVNTWSKNPESAEFWNKRRWIGWIEQYIPDIFAEKEEDEDGFEGWKL
jgi:hypothetical protein